jgi:hypothetical protein
MNITNSITAVTLTILFVASTCGSPIANARPGITGDGACSIVITSLMAGDKVGASVTLKGKASIPPDGNLWILSHKSSIGNQWWPQAGPLEILDGEWKTEVFFGRPADVGSDFDVAAVVVNAQTSGALVKWFATAKALDYPPVPFPDGNSSCPVVKVKVVKVD